MLSIKDRIELHKLNKKLRKLQRLYDADIKKAEEERKSRNDIEAIIAEKYGVCREYEFDIDKIQTRYLLNKARSLYINIPEKTDEKVWLNEWGYYILTEHGKSLLNRKIRVQRKGKSEFLIKIITAFLMLVGVLTSLITILRK